MKMYDVRARADGGAELLIYGDIGQSWDAEESNDAKTVVEKLQEMSGDLDIRINSYGGSVADGVAIFNALRRHSGDYSHAYRRRGLFGCFNDRNGRPRNPNGSKRNAHDSRTLEHRHRQCARHA